MVEPGQEMVTPDWLEWHSHMTPTQLLCKMDFSQQHTVFQTGWLLKRPCLLTCLRCQHTRCRTHPGCLINPTSCSTQVQWYRPLWTHLCHCSLHPWWPRSHSRWVTSPWAVQERLWPPTQLCKEHIYPSMHTCRQHLFLWRKMVHSHKWTHPATIPHTPTNKPSSAEVTLGQQLKQSCLQMQWTLRIFHCFAQVLQSFKWDYFWYHFQKLQRIIWVYQMIWII